MSTAEETVFFCCHGCKAVYLTINGGGFSQYYQQRSEQAPSQKDSAERATLWQQQDLALSFDEAFAKNQRYISNDKKKANNTGFLRAAFFVKGMRCSACAWLIESGLAQLSGVQKANVTLFDQKLVVTVSGALCVSEVVDCIESLGYEIVPWSEDVRAESLSNEKVTLQRRMGVAGLLMMQVGMLALAMYFSGINMSPDTLLLIRVASALLATVAISYCASPIIKSAFSSLWRFKLNMDVPIALALFSAYGMSILGTFFGWPEVYFDTVCMFVFFVLLSRFFELNTRFKVAVANNHAMPQTTLRCNNYKEVLEGSQEFALETVNTEELTAGDIIYIDRFATITGDGRLLGGMSDHAELSAEARYQVNEAIFSGESEPVEKREGSRVSAGCVNLGSAFFIKLDCDSQHTRFSQLSMLAEQAQEHKPIFLQQIDRVVPWFIAGVLALAAASFLYWQSFYSQSGLGESMIDAWKIALTVLVVSCPCALALATPMGHALGNLASKGLGVTAFSENLLPRLAGVTDVIFDKTGTLTQINESQVEPRYLNEEYFSQAGNHSLSLPGLIIALEQDVDHPLARTLVKYASSSIEETMSTETNVEAKAIAHNFITHKSIVPGCGVEAEIHGQQFRMGSPAWALALIPEQDIESSICQSRSLLVCGQGVIAAFDFPETLAEGARPLCAELNVKAIRLHIVSGDRQDKTSSLAKQLGIGNVCAECSPEDKLAYLQQLQNAGGQVLVIGDGVNDAPVFSAANASIAVLGAAAVSQYKADAVLTTVTLQPVSALLSLARSTRSIVRQNIFWAVAYNSTSLPLAAMGLLPAWGAALGMSLSSLLVVANAHRLLLVSSAREDRLSVHSGIQKKTGLSTALFAKSVSRSSQKLLEAGGR